MRLVDADAYSAEMKDRQAAAWKWRNEAIAEEDEVKLARAEGAYAAFTEAKLTMDKHIINPWHRVEDGLPKDGQCCLFFTIESGRPERDAWFGIYRNYWEVDINMRFDYWMPIEPPKEDE